MKYDKVSLAILFFLISWAISVFLPDLIFGDATNPNALYFLVPVPVQEQANIYYLGLHLSTFFEFLFPAILIPISLYLLYHEITKYQSNVEDVSKYNKLMKILIWGALLTFMVGMGIHYTGDAIDTSLSITPAEINYSASAYPKLLGYFFDEVLGHKVEYAGLMLFLTSLSVYQIWHKRDIDMYAEGGWMITFPVFGGVFGIALAMAFMEGQSAFDYLIICLIQLIIIVTYFFIVLKFSINEFRLYPYLAYFITMNATFVITLLILLPTISFVYPFYPQRIF
ncbi:MAG: hypothetical protein EAX96_16725 [Candidatus Lokiarchaeota archaeon]|nr:hypothetical protein [Candidatus Lokiarchaeota archaeon]